MADQVRILEYFLGKAVEEFIGITLGGLWGGFQLRAAAGLCSWVASLVFGIRIPYLTHIFFSFAFFYTQPHLDTIREIWNVTTRDGPPDSDPLLEQLLLLRGLMEMILRVLVLLLVSRFELLVWFLWSFPDSNLFLLLIGLFICFQFFHYAADRATTWARHFADLSLIIVDEIYALRNHWTSHEGGSRSTSFLYYPLDSSRSQIRLIQITKSTPFARPIYSLFVTDLTEAPAYDAMSYTWGGQGLDQDVPFDGHLLKTTLNVKKMLQQRASCMRTTYLWIDAVCINQNDKGEKSSQVSLMGKIYSQAKWTLVWLDSIDSRPSDAIRIKITLSLICLATKYLFNDVELLDLTCYHLSNQNLWGSVERFLAHPYWGRMWILQEVSKGKEVHILYGGQFIHWDNLINSLQATVEGSLSHQFTNHVANRQRDGKSTSVQNKVSHIKECRQLLSHSRLPLSLALQVSARLKASLPSDKIFGLRSLVVDDYDNTSSLACALNPDYNIDYTQVFTRAAIHLLYENPDYVLDAAGLGWPRTTSVNAATLPSWVPDWLQTRDSGLLGPGYYAGGEKDLCLLTQAEQFLGTPALEISPLATVTPPIGSYSALYSAALKLVQPNMTGIYHPTGEPCAEAFWRTLIGDAGRERFSRSAKEECVFPAPVKWGKRYLAFTEKLRHLDRSSESLLERDSRDGYLFWADVMCACNGRGFAVTEEGHMALVPQLARAGDVLCVIFGLQMPFLLREKTGEVKKYGQEKVWELVGSCYVHGLMKGEALSQNREAKMHIIF